MALGAYVPRSFGRISGAVRVAFSSLAKEAKEESFPPDPRPTEGALLAGDSVLRQAHLLQLLYEDVLHWKLLCFVWSLHVHRE